jgi:hypothetical protein
MNEAIVADYVAKLKSSLGDDNAFMRVFADMKRDSLVRQVEAVNIVGRLISPMAASTPKKEAFERILQRHKDLVTFDLKKRAVRGRSAA